MTHILIFIHWFVLVFTFGNVELVTIDNSKSNDFPIEELNNHTLREVFESYTVDISERTVFGITWAYDKKIVISNGTPTTNVYLNVAPNMIMGNKVYYNLEYITGTLDGTAYLFNNSVVQLVETNNDYSGFHIIDYTDFRFRISNGTVSNNYSSYLYVSDIDDLGISHLSLEQMDDWFNIYRDNAQREISQTYDYIENELTTNDLIYIVLFALLWGLAIKFVKGVM